MPVPNRWEITISNELSNMQEEVLKVISSYYPIPYKEVVSMYLHQRSFDMTIEAINWALSHNRNLEDYVK